MQHCQHEIVPVDHRGNDRLACGWGTAEKSILLRFSKFAMHLFIWSTFNLKPVNHPAPYLPNNSTTQQLNSQPYSATVSVRSFPSPLE